MATTGIARAAGYADYSSTGTGGQFTPEIWSMLLTEKVFPNTVFSEICALDWQGEIQRMGDTVHIRTTPDMNINTYQIGQTITYQVPTSTPTSLTIDKGLYWAYAIDDIDRYEADIELMDNFTQSAVQQTMVVQDQTLLAGIPAQAGTTNSGNNAGAQSGNINLGSVVTPLSLSSTNIVDSLIFAASQALDENNIPYDGRRWIVLPSWAIRKLRNSEIKFVYETGDAVSPARNGKVGRIADFTVYQSNNLYSFADNYVNTWDIPFGWSPGLAWASQFTETGVIPLESKIGVGVRSVCAYGFNTVVPKFVGNVVAQQASG
jgi:hypothetical protein